MMVNEPLISENSNLSCVNHMIGKTFFLFITLIKLTAVTSCILSDLCDSAQKRTSCKRNKKWSFHEIKGFQQFHYGLNVTWKRTLEATEKRNPPKCCPHVVPQMKCSRMPISYKSIFSISLGDLS